MATELNIEIDQGATWVKQMLWQDAEATSYDLSNHTARMQVRKNYADLDKSLPLISLTSNEGGGITLGDGTGDYNITITMTDIETTDIPLGQYYYDLELEDDTSVTKLLRGKLFILGEVTR